MATGMYGVSAYQQTNQTWKKSSAGEDKIERSKIARTSGTDETAQSDLSTDSTGRKADITEWKPVSMSSPLVPRVKEGYGMTIGDVELSDDAKKYYDKLKAKFGNAEFILVSKDMKDQVKKNASAYGNANKMVVLIDEEKLERMATDESFRKKYEGIIAMSQTQLANAKNSLASSGASVKSFGMSVNSDGSTSFFATLEKSSQAQTKRLEKKAEAKKEQKVKEKKKAEKEARESRLEKARDRKRAEKKEWEAENTSDPEEADDREFLDIKADSMEALLDKVQQYAYQNRAGSVMADAERTVGQHFDLRF